MNRTKKVLYNSLTAFLGMIIRQIIALTVSIKVLEIYGPDYHGLNSVLSHFMMWFLLLEGGLTTASTVAMYKPFIMKDYERCNSILSASRIKFIQVGVIILLAGLIASWIFPIFLKTPIPYWQIGSIFSIMTLGTFWGIFYTRKYGIMYTVTQNEYISGLIGISMGVIANLFVLIISLKHFHYILIRLIYFINTILDGLIISWVIKTKCSFINYHVKPDMSAIKGTKDVVMQKLTGIIRASIPSLYIASFLGTSSASIYTVNVYGYSFVRGIILHIFSSTQSGIGQIVAERSQKEVYKIFRVFEYIGITALMLTMSTAFVMTIPFVHYYTRNLSNSIQYVNHSLWIILAINISIQMLHIPSGIIINMNAKFKEDRNFQIANIIVMLLGVILFGYYFKLEGIMIGVTLGSLTLGVCEIYYARTKIFNVNYYEFFKPLFIDLLVLVPCIIFEYRLFPQKINIVMFFVYAIISGCCHMVLLIIINLIFERERFFLVINRMKKIIIRNDALIS